MVANKEKLQEYLEEENLSEKDFARRLRISQSEANKLLSGERVGYDTAKKFIYYFQGVIAQHYIDWESTEAENPLTEDYEENRESELKQEGNDE